ncbi:anaphase-promoting complex Apc10DOC1 subunit [Protomyces lactucae-debilis]|uniref:Anaphase-promoting complex subunit 10 n=1 Tax=Protomyces lactucae-debilis TaxID=2754530 RepID=A0A1Y2F489_PROLT|nr:anaphase-promoting complex Apc10DOC1 subunit [Protomyces lactucae-debilis]ORY78673.1 anaphase-promoting complex Apc10DOC1 subunit [Protomyces lactucae-debilis]
MSDGEPAEAPGEILDKQLYKEIGNLASWTVSSEKPGFEIDVVRDDNLDTYWQSDGPQPHYINVHFSKRVLVEYLSIYLRYEQDESYTPSRILLRSGTGYHDLQDVVVLDLDCPTGWKHVNLGEHGKDGLLRTHLLQICVIANHQNGKDTHIRAIKVFTPRR